MKKIAVSIIISILALSFEGIGQVQIGNDLDGENSGDLSGHSVAITANGNIVAIGAIENNDGGSRSGHVRVYENLNGTWTQIGEDIAGETVDDRSGWSLALSADGSIVAIGSDLNNSWKGQVEVYENVGGAWTQIGEDIEGENFQDISATSISLSDDGSIIAIGAPRSDGIANNSGHVRVFENLGGSWMQIGQDIDGEQEQGRLGNAVSLNGEGNIVAIGASQNDENGTNTGEVKVYENIDGTWTQLGGDINGLVEFEDSGSEVALSQVGNIVAISSASSNANGLHSGRVRIFEYIGGVWTQVGEDIIGEASEDYFGWSIALSASGNVIAIGSLWNDNTGSDAGNVRIFQNLAGAWTQMGLSINGEAANDNSGFSVDISDDGSTVAIGAKANDGNGDFSGHVRVFDLSSIILSIPRYDLHNNISIFPIPSDESISINGIGDDNLAQFSIFDSRGKLIRSEAETIGSIDISDLSMGIYYLRIESSSSTIVLKFIKE